MVLLFLITVFAFNEMKIDADKDSVQYLAALHYITTTDSVRKQMKKTFRHASKKDKSERMIFCIYEGLDPLILISFDSVSDSISNDEIMKIESGDIPEAVMQFSNCEDSDTKYNLSFSATNASFLTVEISLKVFNPLGGHSLGPSIKFLLEFNGVNEIINVSSQKYMNG